MSNLDELNSLRHVPDVVSQIARLPEAPMGQVQTVGNWDLILTDATYLPFALNVNDWLLVISVGLDDADAYTDVEGISLPDVSNQIGASVTVCRVDAVSGACILRPSARLRQIGFVYRGLGFNETALLFEQPFAWNGAQTLLSAEQAEINYIASAPLQGTSAQVANVTIGNAKPEYLTFNYTPAVPNYWWALDIYAGGNPAIDPDDRVTIVFHSGDRPSPIPETSAYVDLDPAFDASWGHAQFYTAVFPTLQVPLIEGDPGNSAPVGTAHQPIFTKPPD